MRIINTVQQQILDLVKEVTETQGGQWIEKKELRKKEASSKYSKKFNPKTARTRSFEM
ncbi:MAG: hypothetical protein IPK35_02535 [Saprospiraceae bacterium]|jgi:hypothetical protein|nr:hypothetical protein [Saprospiraceae bacterium]